ncbi:MAG: cupin domain-containing protein [Anaerolineae bacterium]
MIVRSILAADQREEQVHGGKGQVSISRPLVSPDFVGPWHFVDYAVLPPGSSIGLHRHGEDEELYFILEGEGVMTVDGERRRVSRGDLILNRPGGTHGLENDSDSELSILVIEVGLCERASGK